MSERVGGVRDRGLCCFVFVQTIAEEKKFDAVDFQVQLLNARRVTISQIQDFVCSPNQLHFRLFRNEHLEVRTHILQ